ncbi:MAG: hypothetical protein AAB418_01450 [candidate division NC10 bacterium]
MRMRVTLAIVAALALAPGTAAASDHSGTVMAIDPDKGTIVVGEVGPWQLKDGKTEITRQTIVVTPSTRFVASKRSREPGPAGWPGEFVEVPLSAWAVKPGDFVTVHVEKAGTRWTATKITVPEAAE